VTRRHHENRNPGPRVRGRPIAQVLGKWSRNEIAARFYVKVNSDGPVPTHCPELGPCHIWTGNHTSHGYGLFYRIGTHRVVMWLETGEEPGDRQVLHACDNPPGVRRSHLRYGTHQDNMDDKVARDRASRIGKLSDADAEALRIRYAAGERCKDLARVYNISMNQATRIVKGRTRRLAPVATDWNARGRGSAREKLTVAQRAEIKRRALVGERHVDLAREFMIGSAYVSEIMNGRRVRGGGGGGSPRTPLTADRVREVRAQWDSGTFTQSQIAANLGLSQASVSRIVARLSYRDVA
jgi:hypothetical protein